jgi:hypothetical protein
VKKQSGAFFFFFLLVLAFSSCTKINESTELGGNLIPAVDNVNTFDTTIEVLTDNFLFDDTNDSTRTFPSDQHFLGNITNDPLFGTTTANLYLELKPVVYPFALPFRKDSLVNGRFDSAVLVLSYGGTYGDSVQMQSVNVYQVNSNFRHDTSYLLRKEEVLYDPTVIGSRAFEPRTLDDSVYRRNEAARNQLRIPLNSAFSNYLSVLDSANDFKNDSAFDAKVKGFAIVPQAGMGNALIGINLRDTNTKLAIYYREKIGNNRDTAKVFYLRFTLLSASANYVKRNYSGSQLQSFVGGSSPDNQVFIQNTPGSYATIKIPALKSLTNRIVHRAELIMEQIPDPFSNLFTPPTFLYLDALDSLQSTTKPMYRAIPYDLSLTPTTSTYGGKNVYQLANPVEFGMAGKKLGNWEWRFNISRYVQRIVNKTEPFYELRLSSPSFLNQFVGPFSSSTNGVVFVNPLYAVGRVRLGGGINDRNLPNRMRLRIVYSKL